MENLLFFFLNFFEPSEFSWKFDPNMLNSSNELRCTKKLYRTKLNFATANIPMLSISK
jgi:hypothetical protein